jgi:endonuclease/exonuclease/phosphatase family metal-dependent hydrolase
MLRLLTYNLYLGGSGRLEAIYTVLARTQANLIALAEADDPYLISLLAERLGMYHVWAEGSGRRHIATLSCWPIIEWQVYRTPPLTQAVLETKIAGNTGPLTLYNVHLLPYPLWLFELRRWQAVGKFLQVIQARRPGAHLIAGDLNAVARHDRVLPRFEPAWLRWLMLLQFNRTFRLALPRLLKAGYIDCFRRLHPHADGFTWATHHLTTRCDYILADPAFAATLQTCRVIDDVEGVTTASDHLPLLAEFKWEL